MNKLLENIIDKDCGISLFGYDSVSESSIEDFNIFLDINFKSITYNYFDYNNHNDLIKSLYLYKDNDLDIDFIILKDLSLFPIPEYGGANNAMGRSRQMSEIMDHIRKIYIITGIKFIIFDKIYYNASGSKFFIGGNMLMLSADICGFFNNNKYLKIEKNRFGENFTLDLSNLFKRLNRLLKLKRISKELHF